MVFVGPVQPPVDQVVDVIAVRNGVMSTLGTVGVRGVAPHRIGVVSRMLLVHRDHMLVNVLLVRMVEMAVVEVVHVVVVTYGGVATTRSVLV
jgi:hypothetical protein